MMTPDKLTPTLLEEEPTRPPTWPPGGRTGDWWMFWQEERPNTPPEQLLQEALAYFTRKYQITPNQAKVPLSWDKLLVNEDGQPVDMLSSFSGLKIRPVREIAKGHLWLTYIPNGKE